MGTQIANSEDPNEHVPSSGSALFARIIVIFRERNRYYLIITTGDHSVSCLNHIKLYGKFDRSTKG